VIGKLTRRIRTGVPRGTWLLMILSGLAIVTAYLREAAFASYFGASGELDALLVALTIPRMLALLAAVITVAVVLPVYVGYREDEKHAEAGELVRRWFWLLVAVGGVLCVVLFVAAVPLVAAMAPGLTPERKDLAVTCLRWMLPFLWPQLRPLECSACFEEATKNMAHELAHTCTQIAAQGADEDQVSRGV